MSPHRKVHLDPKGQKLYYLRRSVLMAHSDRTARTRLSQHPRDLTDQKARSLCYPHLMGRLVHLVRLGRLPCYPHRSAPKALKGRLP